MSGKEEDSYLKIRQFRDKMFLPLTKFLAEKKVKPNTISYLGFLMIVPFIFFLGINGWLALLFLILNFVLDSLDGALARYNNQFSGQGDFIDHCFDYAGFLAIFLGLLYNGLFNGFWACFYITNYLVSLGFISYSKMKNINIFWMIKSRSIIYLFYLILVVTGWNFFDPILVFFGIYMLVSNLFLFDRIRCSLR